MTNLHGRCKTVFFAGTDTDVGKTYVAARIAAGLRESNVRVGVYKPVASGCQRVGDEWIAEDARRLWQAAGMPGRLDEVCPQRFEAPLAPPEAADRVGRTVDTDLLRDGASRWRSRSEVLIVEGAGGLFSPLSDQWLNIDLVEQLLPAKLMIVAADRLGVIHQVLATCRAALHHGIRPAGVLLSQVQPRPDESSATNLRQLQRHSEIPILGRIDHGAIDVDRSILEAIFKAG